MNVSHNTSHNSSVDFVHKKWEPAKKDSFINNIDSNMVNELNRLLDNSHNLPLNKNQIDFFAESIKNIFKKVFKNRLKSTQLCQKS